MIAFGHDMTTPRERTLTALLSTFGRGEGATVPLLLTCGRGDRPDAATTRAVALTDALVIGRGAGDADPGQLLLDDPLVSGQHVRLARTSAGYEANDLGS